MRSFKNVLIKGFVVLVGFVGSSLAGGTLLSFTTAESFGTAHLGNSDGRTPCAITANGSAQCWGEWVPFGASMEPKTTPFLPAGLASGVSSISTNQAFGCAVISG